MSLFNKKKLFWAFHLVRSSVLEQKSYFAEVTNSCCKYGCNYIIKSGQANDSPVF